MAPRGKKKETGKGQLSIKGFFTSRKRTRTGENAGETKSESPKKKLKVEKQVKSRRKKEDASQNNNNNTINNNNNNNIEKPIEEKPKGRKPPAARATRKEKETNTRIIKGKQKVKNDKDVDARQEKDVRANEGKETSQEKDAEPTEEREASQKDVEASEEAPRECDEDDTLDVDDPTVTQESCGDTDTFETFILKPPTPAPKEDTTRFKCKVCDEWFPNRYFQRKHMLMEHEDQRYECRVCSFVSVHPEKLKSHIIKQHVAKKERISESMSLDAIQLDLEELITKHTPRKVMMEDGVALGRDSSNKMRFICAICERIYTSKYSLERHVRCHTGEKPYSCDVCDFSTSYREHMQRHMTSVHLIVHSDEPKLKYVPKNRKKTEEKNVSTEDIDEPTSNGVNDESFNSNDDSSAGKKRRNIIRKRFECAACGMKGTHKSDLIEHIKEKHPKAHIESLNNGDGSKVHLIVTVSKKVSSSKKMSITCPDCSKVFHDTWKYKVHMRSHTGVKPFGCSICSFFATSKMTIRDHMHRKHKDVKNPKFLLRTVCIDGTVDHLEMNMPQREFKCNLCDKVFQDNYHLKRHKKTDHSESLPFSCVDCGHREWARANMIMHCMSEHPDKELDNLVLRNGKPLNVGLQKLPKCDQCNKIFPYQSQLYIHQKQHTGERSFFCDLCNYSTNHKAALSKHMQKHMEGYDKPTKSKKKGPGRKKTAKDNKESKLSDSE